MSSLLKELGAFLRAVFLRWVVLVTGGVLAALAVAYITVFEPASYLQRRIWLGVILTAVVVAIFDAWRREHGARRALELVPQLSLVFLPGQKPYEQERRSSSDERFATRYVRVGACHDGARPSVANVTVAISKIEPEVEGFPVFHKLEMMGGEASMATTVGPQPTKFFDVLAYRVIRDEGPLRGADESFTFCLATPRNWSVPLAAYRIHLIAESPEAKSGVAWFRVSVDEKKLLQFEPDALSASLTPGSARGGSREAGHHSVLGFSRCREWLNRNEGAVMALLGLVALIVTVATAWQSNLVAKQANDLAQQTTSMQERAFRREWEQDRPRFDMKAPIMEVPAPDLADYLRHTALAPYSRMKKDVQLGEARTFRIAFENAGSRPAIAVRVSVHMFPAGDIGPAPICGSPWRANDVVPHEQIEVKCSTVFPPTELLGIRVEFQDRAMDPSLPPVSDCNAFALMTNRWSKEPQLIPAHAAEIPRIAATWQQHRLDAPCRFLAEGWLDSRSARPKVSPSPPSEPSAR